MRLTLRTLLAYLDEILDPSDREELAKRIESSEFATDLIHRTRDTMRRLRLSAPQPLGTGMAFDPNTVAEYLDNVLPPEGVSDFERICLESDVHLAEVASCHHVLTMVLGEPASVDTAARERMYAIASEAELRRRLRVEPAHWPPERRLEEVTPAAPSQLAASRADEAVPAGPAIGRTAVEIPDYLRTSTWSQYRGLLTLIAAALLVTATVVFAFGLTDWFRGQPSSVAVVGDDGATMPAPPAMGSGDQASPDAQSTDPSAVAADNIAGSPPSGSAGSGEGAGHSSDDLTASSAEATPPPLLAPGSAAPPSHSSQEGGESQSTSTPEEPAFFPELAPDFGEIEETPDRYADEEPATTDATPGDVAPAASTLPIAPDEEEVLVDTQGEASSSPDVEPRVASSLDDSGGLAIAVEADEAGTEPSDLAPPADSKIGTYLGGKTVLLRFDEEEGAWFRLAPRTTVKAGDKLLSLPAFRPRITLASGVSMELVGGTMIEVTTSDKVVDGPSSTDSHVPVVEIVYGRLILVNVAPAEESQVRLSFGNTVGDVQLSSNAALAVEVEREYVPGRDPRQTPAPVVAYLYAPNGHIVWTDDSGSKTLERPGSWTVRDGAASEVVADHPSPDWIDRDPEELLSELRHGAPVVEQILVTDRPIDNQLLELFQGSSRREVKSLVARCSVHAGLFVPFVDALRDSEQKAVWKMHIETLRSAMALSPESAERIWETLVDQRGERAAADLYEMLCGYDEDQIGHTQEEVENGAIARLIDRLADDNLDYRVLAVHNLREITGKTLMPNPAGSLNEREQGIRHWRTRLKSGELRPPAEP